MFNLRNSLLKIRMAFKSPRFAFAMIAIILCERLSFFYARYIKPKSIFRPKQIIFRITEKCFLNCIMCGQRGEKGKFTKKEKEVADVPLPLIYKLADEMSKWPIKPLIKFTGGEPLTLSYKLIDLIAYFKKRGFAVRLSTNGVMLKNKKLAEKLVDSGIDVIGFSIDGCKKIHNHITGRDFAFDYATRGISNISQIKKRRKLKKPIILITSVISTLNQDQMPSLIKIAKEKGIDWLNFQFFNFTTKELSEKSHKLMQRMYNIDEAPWKYFMNEDLAKINVDKIYNSIKEIKSKKYSFAISFLNIGNLSKENIKDYFYNPKKPLRHRMCYGPFISAPIVPPGKICFCIDYPFYSLGDLNQVSLEKSWFGKKASNFRKGLVNYYKENKNNFPHCMRCNWRFNY